MEAKQELKLKKMKQKLEEQQKEERYIHLVKNWNYDSFDKNDLLLLENLKREMPEHILNTYGIYYDWIYEFIQIKNGNFPSIKPKRIVLKKGEICHLEMYGVKMHRYSPNLFGSIDNWEMNQNIAGNIFLTNQRFIFIGERNVTYDFNKIVSYRLSAVDNIVFEKGNQQTKERFDISGHPRQYKALNEMRIYLKTYINDKY